jgi:predicted nucleotidyltransferase
MNSYILKETLEEIIWRLVEGLQPEQIILFGSYAYGHPTEGSDLDIMVIVSESSEPAYRREQKAYACVGAIGVPKDLLVLTREEFEKQARVVTSLARRVKEKGEVLYERGETYRDSEVADKGSRLFQISSKIS